MVVVSHIILPLKMNTLGKYGSVFDGKSFQGKKEKSTHRLVVGTVHDE